MPTPYTLHPKPYTLHPTSHTPHSAPYTLHSTYTLHTTLCTLNPTPYTLHPTPGTGRQTAPGVPPLSLSHTHSLSHSLTLSPSHPLTLSLPSSRGSCASITCLLPDIRDPRPASWILFSVTQNPEPYAQGLKQTRDMTRKSWYKHGT